MIAVIWAVLLWSLAFMLVPLRRIRELWPVIVASFIWLFVLDYIFIALGYYRFENNILMVGNMPLFYLIGGSAGGLLMVNLVPRRPLYKIFVVLTFSGLLSGSAYVFHLFGAFVLENGFDQIQNYVLNVAGLSVLVWISLELTGEEKIYNGNKTRFTKKM